MATPPSVPRATGLIATKGIELLTFRTPNGHKISILLEELKAAYGTDYTYQCIDLPACVNKEPWYRALSPNSRIPCIVDHDHNSFVLFESQAILQYLIRRLDTEFKLSFEDEEDKARCEQWLSFCTGELTPSNVAAIQFYRFMPVRFPESTRKFMGQVERCFDMLDFSLKDRDYLVGPGRGRYSVADMANWTYVNFSRMTGVGGLERWPALEGWWERIWGREEVKKGVDVPFAVRGMGNEGFKAGLDASESMREAERVLRESNGFLDA